MWYGLGAPGISSWLIARFISSAIASRISLVTALDGGPRLGGALGASLPVLDTSRSGGLAAGLGAFLAGPGPAPVVGSGPAGALPGASTARAPNAPRVTIGPSSDLVSPEYRMAPRTRVFRMRVMAAPTAGSPAVAAPGG